MLVPRIHAVTINCSIGQAGDPLERARRILEDLVGKKPLLIRAKKTIKPFGIHKKMPMGWKITLRGEEAFQFLKKAFTVVDNVISDESIDEEGNFAFGVPEHIRIPGTKYVPELGVIGFDVIVTMERAGYRIKRRRLRRTKVPRKHRLTKEDTKLFLQEMGVEVIKGPIEKEEFY